MIKLWAGLGTAVHRMILKDRKIRRVLDMTISGFGLKLKQKV